MPGGTASAVLLSMLVQPATTPDAGPTPANPEAGAPSEPPVSAAAPVAPTAPPPAAEPVYTPLWGPSAPPPRAPTEAARPRRSGDGMLICGGLLAGGFAATLPLAAGVYRSEATCECSGDGFCGCGLGGLAVTPLVIFAAAPTLPLLWIGAWRRGRSDEWRGLIAPGRLRALGWSMLGVGVAFAVAGGVTLSQSLPESPAGTVVGSALIGGSYATLAASGGVLLYTSGRRRGAAEMKLTAGGGLTLWF